MAQAGFHPSGDWTHRLAVGANTLTVTSNSFNREQRTSYRVVVTRLADPRHTRLASVHAQQVSFCHDR